MKIKQFLAASITIFIAGGLFLPMASQGAPGQTNSVNDGKVITGGTYYNTSGNKTLFKNSSGGGLWLQSSSKIRGLQVNGSNNSTGDGGTIHLYAPDSVVRIDGTIDVSALKSGSAFIGNGGKVLVDSAYLYQTGQIFANGINGGSATFNVGAATFGPLSRIEAMGFGGNGGKVVINGNQIVDIQSGAVIATTGKTTDAIDTNVITIVGSLVNNAGILKATGIYGSTGGTISLKANGGTDNATLTSLINGSDLLSTGEKTNILGQWANLLSNNKDGSILNSGLISVSGGNELDDGKGGNGGLIQLEAAGNYIYNSGSIQANGGTGDGGNGANGKGGNGGTILMKADYGIRNAGNIQANGGNGGNGINDGSKGGNGGSIQMTASHFVDNFGAIRALGGNGGNGANNGGKGGNGGNIDIKADYLYNACCIDVSGGNGGDGFNGHKGGDGGTITLNSQVLTQNVGHIIANGGNGGDGTNNPPGDGDANKGGSAGDIDFTGDGVVLQQGTVQAQDGQDGAGN